MHKQLLIGLVVVFGIQLALGAAAPDTVPGSPERRGAVDLSDISPARADAVRQLVALSNNESGIQQEKAQPVQLARRLALAELLERHHIKVMRLKKRNGDRLDNKVRAVYVLGDYSLYNQEVLAMINDTIAGAAARQAAKKACKPD